MKTMCMSLFARFCSKLVMLLLFASTLGACNDDNSSLQIIPSDIKVTQSELLSSYVIPENGSITVLGKGFESGDKVTLTDSLQSRYSGIVSIVNSESITFSLDSSFPQKGTYTVRVHRNNDEVILGSTYIELVCDFGVSDIVVDSKYSVMLQHPITIQGVGFASSDVLTFTQVANSVESTVYQATTVSADEEGITVLLPDDMPVSSYVVRLNRNGRNASIGTTTITLLANTDMEAKDGATVMGTVYCGTSPIENVVVSDGVNLTYTDAEGHYWLNSTKQCGTVFISIPRDYTVPLYAGTNTPHHYALLTKAASEVEQHDFELVAENQHEAIIMGFADAHLANRNNDASQFANGFIVDANAMIAAYQAEGKPVYGITLGDLSWDTYWYTNSFTFADAILKLYDVKCPTFNCMGNHDNDLNIASDYEAARVYIDCTGPNYYSINIGSAHVIVLDNIVYGAKGVSGASGCEYYFDDTQWEWLKKDLETIKNKSNPLLICMHHALHKYPQVDADGNALWWVGLDNGAGDALVALLKDYTDVRVITGHTHVNFDAEENDGTLKEQNVAAICGTWWWTGKNDHAGNNICRDGVPGGYGIWKLSGTNITYQYKSTGYPLDYQFRTTDLNQVYITLDKYAPKYTFYADEEEVKAWMCGYDELNTNNEVMINVFNFGVGWTIKVEEELASGKLTEIKAKRTYAKDPLHVISYQMQRLNRGDGKSVPTSGMVTTNSSKIFIAQASASNTTLHITVTDPYGNVYTETMERPKAFHCLMK